MHPHNTPSHKHTHTLTPSHPHRSHANVVLGETDAFQVNHVYKDDDTYAVVTAASEVLGECDLSVYPWEWRRGSD